MRRFFVGPFSNQRPNCQFQVLNAAWDVCIPVASENALPCHDRVGYNKILDSAKPSNDLDGRHCLSFTYLRLSPLLMERHNFIEFERFVKRMHGKVLETVFQIFVSAIILILFYCIFILSNPVDCRESIPLFGRNRDLLQHDVF